MRLRQTALALALLSAPLILPASLHATRSDPDDDPFTRLSASGSGMDGSEFIGTLDVQGFEVRDGQLVALGTLSGQITRLEGTVAEPASTLNEAQLEVPIGSMVATCDRLGVTFGPVALDLHAPTIQVAPIRIEAADQAVDGAVSRAELCAVADQLAAGPPPSVQAGVLDSVHDAFD